MIKPPLSIQVIYGPNYSCWIEIVCYPPCMVRTASGLKYFAGRRRERHARYLIPYLRKQSGYANSVIRIGVNRKPLSFALGIFAFFDYPHSPSVVSVIQRNKVFQSWGIVFHDAVVNSVCRRGFFRRTIVGEVCGPVPRNQFSSTSSIKRITPKPAQSSAFIRAPRAGTLSAYAWRLSRSPLSSIF